MTWRKKDPGFLTVKEISKLMKTYGIKCLFCVIIKVKVKHCFRMLLIQVWDCEFINKVLSWVEENSNLGYYLEKIVQFSFSPKIEWIIFSMLLRLHYVNEESQNMWP